MESQKNWYLPKGDDLLVCVCVSLCLCLFVRACDCPSVGKDQLSSSGFSYRFEDRRLKQGDSLKTCDSTDPPCVIRPRQQFTYTRNYYILTECNFKLCWLLKKSSEGLKSRVRPPSSWCFFVSLSIPHHILSSLDLTLFRKLKLQYGNWSNIVRSDYLWLGQNIGVPKPVSGLCGNWLIRRLVEKNWHGCSGQ